MKCRRCGKDLNGSTVCNFCGFENEEGNVRELSRIEKNFFDGVTIDLDGNGEPKNDSGNFGNFGTRGSWKTYSTGGGGFFSRMISKFVGALMDNNRLAKIAATLIAIAFAGLMLFVALPILFVFLAAGIALFAFSQIVR